MEVQELKAMSQEDLVRLVQEQAETISRLEESLEREQRLYNDTVNRFYQFKDIIRGICNM